MVYEIATVGKGTLYAMPCPVSGQLETTLNELRSDGVTGVVSLLEPLEAEKLGAGNEAELCQRLGLSYRNYPIKDFATAQNHRKFIGFIDELYRLLLGGENIVVHCYAGIGRTGLTIGSILIRHGMPAKVAIDLMSDVRGRNMPQTQGQYEYLLEFEEKVNAGELCGVSDEAEDASDSRKRGGWLKRLLGG